MTTTMTTGNAWMLMRSGNLLNLLDPSPLAWTDADLALRLARTYRWSSESRWSRPLSVAQHSLTVLRIREMQSHAPLSAARRLREALHDADEGFLLFDVPSPVKAQLGDGYDRIASGLRQAIRVRYDLPVWDGPSYAAHKRADRIAAVSEAKHVVGWPEQAIRDYLRLRDAPLSQDPLTVRPGLQPWEPWPEDVAARLFLETLTSLQREAADLADGATIAIVPPKPVGGLDHGPTPSAPGPAPTYVLVEGGCETVEGEVVRGVRDPDGAWDFDGAFTVRTENGDLVRVNGWNCITEVV